VHVFLPSHLYSIAMFLVCATNTFQTLSSKLFIRLYGDGGQCVKLLWTSSRQSYALRLRTWELNWLWIVTRRELSPSLLLFPYSAPLFPPREFWRRYFKPFSLPHSLVLEKIIPTHTLGWIGGVKLGDWTCHTGRMWGRGVDSRLFREYGSAGLGVC
jgi:hypothetical protein